MNGRIKLHTRVATNKGPFGNLSQQGASLLFFARFSAHYIARPPFMAVNSSLHELVADPYRQILVLVHDRTIGVTIVTAVVALLDQRPSFPFLFRFRLNELLNIRMPVLQSVHLGRASGLATALDHIRYLVVH